MRATGPKLKTSPGGGYLGALIALGAVCALIVEVTRPLGHCPAGREWDRFPSIDNFDVPAGPPGTPYCYSLHDGSFYYVSAEDDLAYWNRLAPGTPGVSAAKPGRPVPKGH